jgi:hypothetical protein
VTARGGGVCPSEVVAWVAHAATDTHLTMRAESCWARGVRVVLAPDGGEPLAVEVGVGAGDAFRRVGELRLSPILDVDDYAQVDPRRRDAFEQLTAWVGSHAGEVSFGEEIVDVTPGRGPWWLIAALILVTACRVGRRARISDRLHALALFVGALTLRLALGMWGPLHVNGKGPLWIAAAATGGAQVASYGPGYPELFGPIARIASAPDVALFAANGVVSALVAPLAFGLARALGVSAPRAAFVAALLAVDPIAVRGATSEGYFAVIVALTLGASIAAVCAASAWGRGETARGVGWAVAAALLCAQAVRAHPVAWGPVALAPLVAIAADGSSRAPHRLVVVGAIYAIVATVVLAVDAHVALAVLTHVRAGDLHAPAYSASRIVWLIPLVVLAAVAKAKRPWLLLPAIASLSALLVTRPTYVQSAFWQASFDRLYVVVPLVAVVALASEALGRRARVAAVALLFAYTAACAPAALHTRTTEQLEYRWLRGELAAVPRGCRVVHVARVDKRELYLPTYAARNLVETDFVDVDAASTDDMSGDCAYYVHTSLCSSREGRSVCDAVERRFSFGAADRATFPPLPSSRELPYDASAVDVWIARVERVKP